MMKKIKSRVGRRECQGLLCRWDDDRRLFWRGSHLSRNLGRSDGVSMWVSRGTVFEAEGLASTKTLRNGKEASKPRVVGHEVRGFTGFL